MADGRIWPTAELLDLLYESMQERPPWLSFLEALGRELGSHYCTLFFEPGLRPLTERPQSTNSNPVVGAKIGEQFFTRFLGNGPVRFEAMEPDLVYTLDDFISPDAREDSAYLTEMLRPAGVEHMAWLHVRSPRGVRAWMGVARADADSPITAHDAIRIRAFAPHLTRCLDPLVELQRLERERRAYEDIVAGFGIGVVVLDDQLKVAHHNREAEEFLGAAGLFRIGGDVVLQDSRANQKLRRQMRSLLNNRAAPLLVMGVPHPGSPSVNIVVRRRAAPSDIEGSRPAGLLMFVVDPSRHSLPSADLIARIFALSPAEANLAAQLCAGACLKEAARRLNVTPHTARDYLKQIFSKTELHRQSDLIVAILRSVAPVATGEDLGSQRH